jgi:Ca-activated chloride channel family protein
VEILEPFRRPWALAFLAVPLLLWVRTWRTNGPSVIVPFDAALPRRSGVLGFFVRAAESLPAAALALVIVLVANPQRWEEPRSKRALTNIEFCVDVSGSMTANFAGSDRYGAAMDAINAFLGFRKGDAFGLTFFGNTTLKWVPLTTDVSAFRCAPPFMHPRLAPPWMGGTEIGKALLACRKTLLERDEGDRMIVLISDGYSSDLSGGADEEIARKLAADDITVYMIHTAEPPVPEECAKIATLTGGESFAPQDPGALETVFKKIDGMRKARLEKTRSEAADDFRPWCIAGLAVLALSLLASFGLRRTPW